MVVRQQHGSFKKPLLLLNETQTMHIISEAPHVSGQGIGLHEL
jgi:hypothetical protein